jgi:nucleoside-diphosphate-sugar epimerase
VTAEPLIILGCGFVGGHLARAAHAQGRKVRALSRSMAKLAPLAELGIETKYIDVGQPKQLPVVLSGLHGATVVYSIPPAGQMSPGSAMRVSLQAAYGAGAQCFIYFSSCGQYGSAPDDDIWVDEETPIAHDDPPMKNIMTDEEVLAAEERMRTVILRLAPVYGGGKGVRKSMLEGKYKILDEGQHVTSRIHIEDVCRIVFACEDRAPTRSKFLVGDDEPTTQLIYATWLSERLGLPLPPFRSQFEPGKPRVAHRNRRMLNTHMKTTLELELLYPSFREGEAANEKAQG